MRNLILFSQMGIWIQPFDSAGFWFNGTPADLISYFISPEFGDSELESINFRVSIIIERCTGIVH